MNSVNLTGRWVKDPTSRQAGETSIVENTIAVDGFKKDETHFIDVKIWGKQAETAQKYTKKGDLAIISGRITQEKWEKDGEKRSKLVVTVEHLTLPPLNKGEGSSGEPATASSSSGTTQSRRSAVVEEDDIF